MKHIVFTEANEYPVALLIKDSSFNKLDISNNYYCPLLNKGIQENFIAFNLKYAPTGKVPVSFIKDYLLTLLPALVSVNAKYLIVADSNYFKALTKVSKTESSYGYALPCVIKGYEHLTVILSVNYQAVLFNPQLQSKLDTSLSTLASLLNSTYSVPGTGIIHSVSYPQGLKSTLEALKNLHQYQCLTCDIEAFSLRFNEAGIATIAFAWDQHNGIALTCDYESISETNNQYGRYIPNIEIRKALKQFFTDYNGTLIWHGSTYDIKVLIYTLWMDNLLDIKGMLTGLDIMTKLFHDTKIIKYLATNNTVKNVLGLKPSSQLFSGNYAVEDINDVRLIPLDKLLEYNLIDALSTWYVKNTYEPVLIADNQLDIYQNIMLPSIKTIIQMELTGMPINMLRLKRVKKVLSITQQRYESSINNSVTVQSFNIDLQHLAMKETNAKLKVKQHPLEHFKDITFNSGSPKQMQKLLYEKLKLPIIDYTETKLPATGADTLGKLVHHTKDANVIALLQALIGQAKVDKILTTFIPAFEKGIVKDNGYIYLHGSFNLGGTISGRLSSSKPNMQNLPSNSKYGKLIKSCFSAPKGWIMVGADFASLEDKINALLTKDPNKLKVYAGITIYELKINGVVHHIRDDDTIEYDGKTFTGTQFYDTYRSL